MLTNWTLRNDSLIGHIDEIAAAGGELGANEGIPRGGYASFRGWLVDRAGNPQPDSLEIAVGDGRRITAALGYPRPDVSDNLGLDGVDGGFYGVGAVTAPVGDQPLVVFARTSGELRPLECKGHCAVTAAVDPLAGLSRRYNGWAAAIDGFVGGDDGAAAGDATIDPGDRPVSLRLWCVDLKSGTPPLAVVARLGGSFLSVIDGIDRGDAARHVGAPGAKRCGYLVPAVAPLVGVGRIELFSVFEDGTFAELGSASLRRRAPSSSRILPADAQISAEIDEIRAGDRSATTAATIDLRQDETLLIRGWAVDTVGPRLTGGVEAYADSTQIGEGRRGGPRPDIVAHLGHSGLSDCEFLLHVDGASLQPRTYQLTLWGLSARRDARAKIATRRLHVRP